MASDHRYFLQEISVQKSQRFKEKPLAVFYFGKVKVVLSCFHEVHVFVLSFVKPFKKCFLRISLSKSELLQLPCHLGDRVSQNFLKKILKKLI